MAVYRSASELVGNTPLLEARNFQKEAALAAKLYAKLEYLNPSGSVKDRIAKAIIEDAEKKGQLHKDSVIIEPTSGNTGIGLAAIATAKGYQSIIVMPDSMSEERIRLIQAYGAEIVLTDGALGMQGAIDKAEELKAQLPGAIIAGQFTNPVNPQAHHATTGPEIWNDLEGKVDVLVAGVGTGGTLSGTAAFLKERNPAVHIAAVEPKNSPVLSEGHGGKHGIQGIGAGFVPKTLDVKVIDEIITVTEQEAVAAAKAFAASEGILVGISAGAALAAAVTLGKKERFRGKNIAVILPDGADRYFSTALFENQ